MGIFKKIVFGVAAFVALSEAHAATVIGTFSGTVLSGTDASGYFVGGDNAGAGLDGASVTGFFGYDDLMPSGAGTGFSIRIFGIGFDKVYNFGSFATSTESLSIHGANNPDGLSFNLQRFDDVTFDSEAFSLSLDGTEFLTANGIPSSFNFFNPTSAGNGVFTIARSTDQTDVSAFLSITSARTIQVGTVPEPTTWAMLILGFVAIGIQLRRRSRPSYSIN